jgi:hypothetical protein
MNGPCMCGDTHCSSCGPAQGNWRCPLCRNWADDGCEHFDEDGYIYADFAEALLAKIEADAAADDAYAKFCTEGE